MGEIWQAIQPYSGWIIFGVFLLLMMRMHAGGGCGMGHGQHGSHGSSGNQSTDRSAGRPDGQTPDRGTADGTDRDDSERTAVAGRRSGGCH